MLRILDKNGGQAEVLWIVFSGAGNRKEEAMASAGEFLGQAKASSVRVLDFPDAMFPAHWCEIKEAFKRIAIEFEPDLVFTHRLEDRHQDHRVVADLTWQHFRRQTVLEYEIPKYEGDLGQPNLYFALSKETCDRKVAYLLNHFPSQLHRSWFDETTFQASLRLRGIECSSKSGFAEAFNARKLTL